MKEKQDKALPPLGADWAVTNPRSAGVLKGSKNGVRLSASQGFWGQRSQMTHNSRALSGAKSSNLEERMIKIGTKEKFALYLERETKEEINYWYEADNCASRTEFIEKAVNFYLHYLRIGDDNALLPKAVLSAIEGRLGEFETHLSRLMFKQTVELSMMMNLIAADTDIDNATLNKLRGGCVAEVKRTNGQLSFKEILKFQRTE